MTYSKNDFKAVLDKVGIPSAVLKKRPKNVKPREPRREPEKDREQNETESKYRNRALERIQMKDEYKKINEEYELFKKQSEQESKYMGGDEEYTHLVKGLDYKLLNKTKEKIGSLSSNTGLTNSANLTGSSNSNEEELSIGFTDFGYYFYKHFFYYMNLNNLNFGERLQNLIRVLFEGHKLKTNDRIGKTSYNYDLGSDNDLPTTVVDDEVSTGQKDQMLNIFSNVNTKKELIKVFNWHIENRKKKPSERESFRPSNLEVEQEESDDDIYENIEKFDNTKIESHLLEKGEESTRGYFRELEESDEESERRKEETKGKLTYKIPEKLLKKSRKDPSSEMREKADKVDSLKLQEEDYYQYDSDEEGVKDKGKGSLSRKAGKLSKKGSKREWTQISDMIEKNKDISLEKYDQNTEKRRNPNLKFL